MKIDYLSWDSDFFKLKIGKVDIHELDKFEPAEFWENAEDKNYDLVYVFKYGSMLNQQEIKVANLELVNIMLTMSKKFDKNQYENNGYDFRRELTPQELQDCYYIAEQTSIVSRFYNEKLIGAKKTKELYRKWIDNALNGKHSDGLFLFKDLDTVAGIHLVKTYEFNQIGYFTLTGVNPNFKRMGIGRNLWEQSFNYWANEENIKLIKSPFSFRNRESFNFHLKMGFNKVEKVKYVYHYRK